MNTQRKAIKDRNATRREIANDNESAEYPVSSMAAELDDSCDDVDTLLAELAEKDAEIERLTNRLQRSA